MTELELAREGEGGGSGEETREICDCSLNSMAGFSYMTPAHLHGFDRYKVTCS